MNVMQSDSIAYKGLSDAGLVRKNNEDAYAVDVRVGTWPLLLLWPTVLGETARRDRESNGS